MAKGNNQQLLIIAAVGVIAYLLLVGVPGAEKPSTTTEEKQTTCGVEDVSFTPKLTRVGKAGTSLGTGYGYYILTDNLGIAAANESTTIPTFWDFSVMYGENATDYYTKVVDLESGCADPFFHSDQLAYADTSLNSKYIENSDGSVNSDSNEEDMAADDVFEATMTIKAGADEYFGNPDSSCKNIAVVEYDKTFFLKAEGDDPEPVPGTFTYFNSTFDGSNAFAIPKSADGESVSFNIKLESSATAPNTTSVDPRITLFDCDVDKNEDTLELIEGVEDEDLNLISLANQTVVMYVD